jgi:hypothetical protein
MRVIGPPRTTEVVEKWEIRGAILRMHNGDIERDDSAVVRPRAVAIVECQEKFEVDDRNFYAQMLLHIAPIASRQVNPHLITPA